MLNLSSLSQNRRAGGPAAAPTEQCIELVGPELARRLFWEMREGRELAMVRALDRQKAISKANHEASHRGVEGMGQCQMRVDPTIYHHMASVYGYEAMKDPGFQRELVKDNPGMCLKPRYERRLFCFSVAAPKSEGYRVIDRRKVRTDLTVETDAAAEPDETQPTNEGSPAPDRWQVDAPNPAWTVQTALESSPFEPLPGSACLGAEDMSCALELRPAALPLDVAGALASGVDDPVSPAASSVFSFA